VFASDFVPSDTSTDMDDDPWSAIEALTSLHVPVRSSLTMCQDVSDAQESLFMVPAKCEGQRPILFGRVESKSMTQESSESDDEPWQLSHYEPNVLRMMENMGYDLTRSPGLNFGKGRRTLLQSFIPKRKTPDYYHRTRRGLGYVSTPVPSASGSEGSLYHNHSSGISLWESDVSVGNIFRELSVNMVSTSHLKDGDDEMIQSETDPWIKHLNTL